MDKASALRLLPAMHAAALVLDDEGLPDAAIALRIGVDEQAVRPLLEVARAKFSALVAAPAELDDERNR